MLEAGGLCGTDVAIARRERGGHDGVLRERGSAIKLTEPGQTRPQKSEAHHSSIFGKELGPVETTVGSVDGSPSGQKKVDRGKGQCQYSTGGVASPRVPRAEMLSSIRHAPGQGRDGLAIR